MTKQTNKVEAVKAPKGPKLHLKQSASKTYDFAMFAGCAIATYVLWFSGNTVSLKVVAGVLAIDATYHAYKLVAVVK